ncbi:phosphatidylserine decarboxylase family protein [Geofilum rhodophaeum]|uniref:phosphatidylserine decarboxylase family protein n=1 Tax=Geofilum rhodophaeum TaxID=1965019 RepID=UPI000B520233|nr:phosphatidylserine decarboxylase family protein [Geofilum rhodophaeum]
MTIHKEGYRILVVLLLVLVGINVVLALLIGPCLLAVLLSALIFLPVLNFFRSPNRQPFRNDKAIVAPADGKIVVIEEVEEPEFLKGKALQVSVFMNVFNVHINWYPLAGVVRYFRHHSGRFMGAYLPKASTENERTTVALEHSSGKTIVVRQIAGAIARRIVCYSEEGATAEQGAQMGFIKFGSRVDIYLPLDARIDVELGQKVKGRQTIIGWLE